MPLGGIYEVRSVSHDGKVHGWGAFHTRAEANQRLQERFTGGNKEWADRCHARWWIEEIDNSGMFSIPSLPKPRDRFSTRVEQVTSPEGRWDTTHVEVLDDSGRVVTDYSRNHPSLYQTFEPFRQGDKIFALISSNYTATSVVDLATGAIVASEEASPQGFCPVGFYVPDWWDINDGSILPGSMHWNADMELPAGDFGFVWGCIWGDDSSWKVQFLDLSKVQYGEIHRDDRFGYIALAESPRLDVKELIQCSFFQGKRMVTFAILETFDLQSGEKEPV